MVFTYSLLVHSCEEITWVRRKAPNLYVVIQQEGQAAQRTRVIKRERAPTWKYICNLSSDSPIILRLWHDSLLRCRDVSLGIVRTDIGTLRGLTVSDSEFIKLRMAGESREVKDKHTGTLLVQLVQNMEAAAVAIDHVQQDIGKIGQAALQATSTPTPTTFEAGLNLFITKLDVVVKIGDELAQIHPYANVAWTILTSVHQAVKAQQDTDEKLCKLVDTMNRVYSFTKEADGLLPHLKSLEDKILPIIKQTVECAMFIREYTGHGFASRAIRNTWDNANKTIDDLSSRLLTLRDSLESSLNVETTVLTMQAVSLSTKVLQKVDSLVQSDTLKMLHPVRMNAASRRTCLKGTRVQLLDEITEWLMVPTATTNILWLSGVAGSGKSTISTSISVSFGGLHRLGAFLFFDRNNPSLSDPDNVIRTLAYFLALSNPHIGSAISAAIQDDPNIINTPLQMQFERLLLEPLKAVERFIHGPILIILDALDECGTAHSRKTLLSVISTEFPKLPSLFRILITSRREADLTNAFATHFAEKSVGVAASARDVRLFLHFEMERIRQENKLGPAAWPKDTQLQALINLADGLFIWAATAVRFIEGYSPEDRMETVLAGNSATLDNLYNTTLRNSAPWDDGKFATDARAVLACIVFGKTPMTDVTIDILLGSRCQSSKVLKHLGCVIQWQPGCVARILHASFADYLTDALRSQQHPWAITSMFGHYTLGSGCLQILNNQLIFNICGLKDSHVPNVDVPDISSLVASNISPPLSYSSRFWGAHLANCQFDQMILEDITTFFHDYFLFWLEVLSLLGQVAVAPAALAAARNYIESHSNDLQNFLIDATKFVSVFAQLIVQSAPHIYLSAVPFAPKDSIIAKQFRSWFPNTVHFDGPHGIIWPGIQKVLHGHKASANSVTISPDGARVVSGSGDKTICVWNVDTGALIASTSYTHYFFSVCFSPDGTQIASGSSDATVCIWDAETVKLVAAPFTGHTRRVWSVHFSPDGQRIASGSDDHTIRVWDAHTGVCVAGPCIGHTERVNSVHYSPDGTRVASGSHDTTVCIWDAQTGLLLAAPITGHTSIVWCVCFSYDGQRIVSGSADETVRIWDAQTGALVAGPFTGHAGDIHCVHFSLDGKQFISGSTDYVVRGWDAQTGARAIGAFSGHTGAITSLVFSPDGSKIISGSHDGTVRIWDATRELRSHPVFDGHGNAVYSVCFSPNGTRIASGSEDNSVCVWDVDTGALTGSWTGGNCPIRSVCFSPDGAQIACASDNDISVLNAENGALIAGPIMYYLEYDSKLQSICFSPDGRQIATGCTGGTICVWDIQTRTLVAGPFANDTHTHKGVQSIDFSPDGTRIVSGYHTLEGYWSKPASNISIWDAKNGSEMVIPDCNESVLSVCFSPDNKQIASGSTDLRICVWDALTGALLSGPFPGHTSKVTSVHFSPDGTQIASGSNDKTVCVWEVRTGALVAGPFTGHCSAVNSVHFSSDGTQIVSGSKDHTLRVCKVGALGRMDLFSAQTDSVSESRWGLVLDTDSGWIRTTTGLLMLWIPPWLREGLNLPHNTLVITKDGTTRLDLSHFVHGTEWATCANPAFMKSMS